ncbi:MAG: alpha/beta hydrolase [Cellulomonadaceae bacterium]|jgi:pimeloyl-ACP methyl ester carboxylesterase|nr:alpha/beta hydrolase [Cellulomonadaceae bacterium]
MTPAPRVAPDGIPVGFEGFIRQNIPWHPCDNADQVDPHDGQGFDCATIDAPLSWQDPAAGTITLALARHVATGNRQGALLTNPGGPGASGVDYIVSAWSEYGQKLRDAYDVVSFDPRGVQRSTPIVCMDDADKDAFLAASYSDTEAGIAQMAADAEAWGQACARNTGPLLGHVDTQSAAYDMNLIRVLLGEKSLNYMGFSYGTQLGAYYAGLFPQVVGRMVLDGAIDITLSTDDAALQQAMGIEQALRQYVDNCLASAGCPLTGPTDRAMGQIKGIFDAALNRPFPTSTGRDVTQTLAFFGVAVTLYDQRSWPVLTQALQEVMEHGSGNALLYLADFYNDRKPGGSFSTNSIEAFIAIGCLDSRGTTDLAAMKSEAARIIEAAPTVGEFFGYGGITCQDWPYPLVPAQFDFSAPGAGPIVVIGTTHDPATPYRWAQALTNTLADAILLTFDGEGHTAYGRSNACIVDTVDAYLVDGTVPEKGKTC